MVNAVADPKVIVESVPESKAQRLRCLECDWMETAGSVGAATRKKNTHIAEHRASVEGAPGEPTVMDAIEDKGEMPVGSFRKPLIDPEEAKALLAAAKEKPEPVSTPAWEEPEPVAAAPVEEVDESVPVKLDQAMEELKRRTSAFGGAFSQESQEKALEALAKAPKPQHTRTAPHDMEGPDFCAECSDEAQDWVVWPCPYIMERTDPPAATRLRITLQRGSSDRNREAWLAERAVSVSATLVAKLGQASHANIDYVIDREVHEKIHGKAFTGNAYTEWGKQREPFLEQAGLMRYGIQPESHLYFSRANRRHSASPDGIAIHPETGAVMLGEYKTSGKKLDLAKVHTNGYYDQIQWQMYVMEAERCMLLWEWREDDGNGGFIAKWGGEHLILRDQPRIEELIRRADLFLERLDAERARQEAEGDLQVPDELLGLVQAHLAAKEAAKAAEETLRAYCEANRLTALDIPGVAKVSYSYGSPRRTFDKEAFEEAHPGVYEQFLKDGAAPERATLRVTVPRAEQA